MIFVILVFSTMNKVFDLYIDESGDFNENEKGQEAQEFPNQLAGILVPRGKLTEKNAEAILRNCYSSAGFSVFPEKNPVHGLKIKEGARYDRLIDSLIVQIQEQKWQPIRLVNQTRIDYGDIVSNYVNIFAELALRIFQQQSKEGTVKITLNFHCAIVSVMGKNIIREGEYLRALRNYMAFAAVRLGLAAQSSYWQIGSVSIISANKNRRLQICDLLSNASHNNYKKCGEQTSIKLKAAFGLYDYSLVLHPLTEKCELLIEEGSWGIAIQANAEHLIRDSGDSEDKLDAIKYLDIAIDKLANSIATDRDSHLTILINWVEQIVNQQRSLGLGYKLVQWLLEKVARPLADQLESEDISLSWFSYALHFWALTICNHQGNINKAREEATKLTELRPKLANEWEKVPLLMEGLVAEAVHHTDCWEYYEAVKCMHTVVKYYSHTSKSFADALSTVFPRRVRSQLGAKALGTWLQAEIHASSFLPHRLAQAQKISDACIYEFSDLGDRQRQYQYRAKLETVAGDYQTARKYLAKSLNLSDISHHAIAETIKTLDTVPKGFALLHWLRLGTTAYLSDNISEWSEFESAWDKSGLFKSNWCQGRHSTHYPTHGILRRVALIRVIQNKPNPAMRRLQDLNPISTDNLVLAAIQVATYAEVAALNWQKYPDAARKLIDSCDNDFVGIVQLIQTLSAKSQNIFPQFYGLTELWSEYIEPALNGDSEDKVKGNLLKIGTTVNY